MKKISDEDRVKIAMRNAEAIGETLVHHGKIISELENRVQSLTQHVQTCLNKITLLEQQFQRCLVQKYGTGPTTPQDG